MKEGRSRVRIFRFLSARTLRVGAAAICLSLGACSSGATEEALAEAEDLQERVNQLQAALREANDNIIQANGYIQQINASQFGECEDLRFAASSVSTVNEVSEP